MAIVTSRKIHSACSQIGDDTRAIAEHQAEVQELSARINGVGGTRLGIVTEIAAMSHAEQFQDFQVLAGLRHDRIIGRDDKKSEVDPGCASQHVLDEPFVARDVHDAQSVVAEIEMGKTDVDGNAAFFLFGQAVAVDAGQRLHERSLAVINVAGRSENQVAWHG